MKKADDIFTTILGYRKSAYLFHINSLPIEERELLLQRYYKENTNELMKLDKFIKYQQFNYPLWDNLSMCVKEGKPKVNSHHDLSLEDYLIGLNQCNRLAWSNMSYSIFDFVYDKKVLDFGCGGCFYTDIFSNKAKSVCYHDKPDVLEFIDENIQLNSDACTPLVDIGNRKFDVIWISEVIHGKPIEQVKSLLYMLTENLEDNGIIVINELIPNTPLSELFDIQMAIHTKGGRLYNPLEIYNLFSNVTVNRKSDYHIILGGKL